MPSDPRPNTARNEFGGQDENAEERFRVLFGVARGPKSPRPIDAASALVFLQELWDRLSSAR